ncbi:MAG: hypothetical protein MHM6MM_004350, partial [Cercozoa sp. M6MM]
MAQKAADSQMDWDALLRESESLEAAIPMTAPAVSRGLRQLGAHAMTQTQQVAGVSRYVSRTGEAERFFASQGVNMREHDRALRTLSVPVVTESAPRPDALDIEAQLSAENDLMLSTLVDEMNACTSRLFREQVARQVDQEWQRTKCDILAASGHAQASETRIAPRSTSMMEVSRALKSAQSEMSHATQVAALPPASAVSNLQSGLGGVARVYADALAAMNASAGGAISLDSADVAG